MELEFSFCLPDHERIYAQLLDVQSISHGFQVAEAVCVPMMEGEVLAPLRPCFVRVTLEVYTQWSVMRELTLPSECVSLNRPGFEDSTHPRRSCGGRNVGIGCNCLLAAIFVANFRSR